MWPLKSWTRRRIISMTPLHKLFDVVYGSKLDLNKMSLLPTSRGGVHFVGRSSANHGVSASIAPLDGIEPYEAGLITVALGGDQTAVVIRTRRTFLYRSERGYLGSEDHD